MRNQRWSCVYRNQRVCQLRNIAFVIETSQVLLRSDSACPSTWHSTRRKTPKCTTPTNCTDFYKQATKIPPRPTSSKTSRGHPRRYPRQETIPDFRQVKITPRVGLGVKRFRILRPNYIFPSRDPLGTNKLVGACWRNLRGVICANIFAVPRPFLQSPEGGKCWRNFQITWSGKINLAGLECTTPHNSEFK